MPNHTAQQVHLTGPQYLMAHIYEAVKNETLCQTICPMPFEVWSQDDVKGATHTPAWYQWRLDNWDTKWDIYSVEISQEISDPDVLERDAEVSFQFNCETAWSPPIKVWEKLHDMGIIVDASYQDEGMMYEGTFIDGVDTTWTPEEEAV